MHAGEAADCRQWKERTERTRRYDRIPLRSKVVRNIPERSRRNFCVRPESEGSTSRRPEAARTQVGCRTSLDWRSAHTASSRRRRSVEFGPGHTHRGYVNGPTHEGVDLGRCEQQELADTEIRLFGTHFADPVVGTVVTTDRGYRFVTPADSTRQREVPRLLRGLGWSAPHIVRDGSRLIRTRTGWRSVV